MDTDMNEEADKIENLNEELNSFNDDKNERMYELCIKFGDELQLKGDIEKSLECYGNAYDTALFLENKIYQIDSIGKLVQNYIINGEVEKSIKFVEMADELLKDMDYTEGKLEISLCWIKIYYYQNRYFEAREIGNKAIGLCGDKFLIHKGRILNLLAMMYNDLISVDEHLNLLEEALTCFQKANNLRGVLGITNNIAGVYAEKLQNNDKALECYLTIKEISEESCNKEIVVFSNVNIGEIYFKKLMFEEALIYFKDALKMAREASVRNMILYSCSYLILAGLRLNDYGMASNYYKQAVEEVSNYPHQGTTLAVLYKAESELFLELGKIKKAKSLIKQALNSIGKVESIARWNMELVHELIRLRGARNKAEILDVIQSIKFILSKHKNPEAILNIVYDFAIELLESGNTELAYEFLDKYNTLRVDNKVLNMKFAYIEAKRLSSLRAYRIKKLEHALKQAKNTKDLKLSWKLLKCMGNLYLEEDNLNKASDYYYDSCVIIRELLLSVPSEFRTGYATAACLHEPLQKLINLRENFKLKGSLSKFDSLVNEDIFKETFKHVKGI